MAGKPAIAGKKLAAIVSKPAPIPTAPCKTPAQGDFQKSGGAPSGGNKKAEECKPKGKGKGNAEKAAEKAPKAPRAKNAYMFFTAEKRDAVKGERLVHSHFDMLVRVCLRHAYKQTQ